MTPAEKDAQVAALAQLPPLRARPHPAARVGAGHPLAGVVGLRTDEAKEVATSLGYAKVLFRRTGRPAGVPFGHATLSTAPLGGGTRKDRVVAAAWVCRPLIPEEAAVLATFHWLP